MVLCLRWEGSKAGYGLAYIHVPLYVSIELFIQRVCTERVSVILLGVFVCTCAEETLHYASSRSVSTGYNRGFTYQGTANYRISPFIVTKCLRIKDLIHIECVGNRVANQHRVMHLGI